MEKENVDEVSSMSSRSYTQSAGILERGGGRRLAELELEEVGLGVIIVGTGGGGYLGIVLRLLLLLVGKVGSSWALGKPPDKGVGGSGFETLRLRVGISADGMYIESGRAGVWSGKEGGRGERREIVLDSSLLYHSESDSGSESDASSDS